MFNYIMLISLIEKINSINEFLFAPIDNIVEKLPFADWAVDAICDSIHLIPFLFFVFLIIEILEFYYANKINRDVFDINIVSRKYLDFIKTNL